MQMEFGLPPLGESYFLRFIKYSYISPFNMVK